MNHKARAIAGALVLTLAIAAPVAASEATSTTTVSATVGAAISLTGAPASINFGTVTGGQLATYPTFDLSVVSNAPFTVKASCAAFTGPAGPKPTIKFGDSACSATPENIPGGDGSLTTIPTSVGLWVPASAAAGSFSSTISWVAATS